MAILVLLLCLIITSYSKPVFVHEVCRHGARTPIVVFEDYKYKEDTAILTSLGATQMYVLGKELRNRYIDVSEGENLLNPNFDSTEIEVVSTSPQRTRVSAQNQLLGMYGSSNSDLDDKLTNLHERNIKILTEVKKLEVCFNNKPGTCETHYDWTVDDYPVYDPKLEKEFWKIHDEILKEDNQRITKVTIADLKGSPWVGYGQCPVMVSHHDYHKILEGHWEEQRHTFEETIYNKIAEIFNTTLDQRKYFELYEFADVLWSEQFHGFGKRYEFTPEQWALIKQTQLDTNIRFFATELRRVLFTRMKKPILNLMRSKIGLPFDEKNIENRKTLKFLEYSTHDNQLS